MGGDLEEAAGKIKVEEVEQDLKSIGSFTNAFKRNEDGQVLYTNRYVRSSKTNMEGEMRAMYESERISSSHASCSNTKSNLQIKKEKGKSVVIAEEPVKTDSKTGSKAKASDKPIVPFGAEFFANKFSKKKKQGGGKDKFQAKTKAAVNQKQFKPVLKTASKQFLKTNSSKLVINEKDLSFRFSEMCSKESVSKDASSSGNNKGKSIVTTKADGNVFSRLNFGNKTESVSKSSKRKESTDNSIAIVSTSKFQQKYTKSPASFQKLKSEVHKVEAKTDLLECVSIKSSTSKKHKKRKCYKCGEKTHEAKVCPNADKSASVDVVMRECTEAVKADAVCDSNAKESRIINDDVLIVGDISIDLCDPSSNDDDEPISEDGFPLN